MDMLSDLETFAGAAALEDDMSEHPFETVSQYMDLFGLDEQGAIAKIRELRGLLPEKKAATQPSRAVAYLVKLEEHLPTAQAVRAVAGLTELPEVIVGTDDSGRESQFCRVDPETRAVIAAHFADDCLGNAPTFLQLTQATKSLSEVSAAPTLGLDATMPQYRLDSAGGDFRPRRDEYPVWYFVYGPLADVDELAVILRRSDEPEWKSAVVYGARMLSQNAMDDAEPMCTVLGMALSVRTAKDEESLRFSVTDKFEVVRCKMMLVETGELVTGLTFRYIGRDL